MALEFLPASRLSSIFLQDPLPAMRTIPGRKSFQAYGLPGQGARGPAKGDLRSRFDTRSGRLAR
jgi:hypothetical protein